MGCIDVGLFVGNNNEYSVTQLSCINFFELPDRNGVGCIDVCLFADGAAISRYQARFSLLYAL